MKELLEKMLSNEFLTEEIRVELQEAFDRHIAEAVEQARIDATADVRAEVYAKWLTEQENLVDALNLQVRSLVAEDMAALQEDVSKFRDLEAEYATRLVEARADLNEQVRKDMRDLLQNLDSFLEERFTVEMSALKEDIEEVRKNEFGRKIFEAFMPEFKQHFVDPSETATKLRETEEVNAKLAAQIKEVSEQLNTMTRRSEMNRVLAPLSGKQREVMESLLTSVETSKLEEAYRTYVGRIIRETTQSNSITESATQNADSRVVMKTGNVSEATANAAQGSTESSTVVAEFRRLAGITS